MAAASAAAAAARPLGPRASSASASAPAAAALLPGEQRRVGVGVGVGVGRAGAAAVFEEAMWRVEKDVGKDGLVFPKEVTFLNGAPGAGKTHNSRFMLEARGLSGKPIVMSDLLKSRPKFCEEMDKGGLVDDVDVVEALFRELLSPGHSAGVLVDGFPRSEAQAEACWKLHGLMTQLRAERVARVTAEGRAPTAGLVRYPVPRFFVCILHVSEEQSIARQTQRGRDAVAHNARVREIGADEFIEERATDLDPRLLKKRYRTFESHRATLDKLKTYFPSFKIIDASPDVETVRDEILREFQYQSKQDLSRAAFDAIQPVPLASRVGSNARPDLCQRLGEYASFFPERFASAVAVVNDCIVPRLRDAAFAGTATVRFPPESQWHAELSYGGVCSFRQMVLDTLAERGYSPSYDAEESLVPTQFDVRTGKIDCAKRVVHVFRIGFPEAKLSHDNIRALNENRESEEPQADFPSHPPG